MVKHQKTRGIIFLSFISLRIICANILQKIVLMFIITLIMIKKMRNRRIKFDRFLIHFEIIRMINGLVNPFIQAII